MEVTPNISLNKIDSINSGETLSFGHTDASNIEIGNLSSTTFIKGKILINDLSLNTLTISGESINDIIQNINNNLTHVPLDISLSSVDISGDSLIIGPSDTCLNVLGNLKTKDISANKITTASAELFDISTNNIILKSFPIETIIDNKINSTYASIPHDISLSRIDVSGDKLLVNGNIMLMIFPRILLQLVVKLFRIS